MTEAEKRMEEYWFNLWRKTPEPRRFSIGMEMMTSLRKRIAAGVRELHPDWSEKEVQFETFRRLYFKDLSFEQIEKIRKDFLGR